ncbi:MAG: hypothetical protein ABS939_15730 [Psychrobacillus sp.]
MQQTKTERGVVALLVLLTYIISALSWGLILLQLTKATIATRRHRLSRPPLLIPLAVASLALFIESVYFGFSAWFAMIGKEVLFLATFDDENWFLIKLLVAISGVLLLFNLKIDNK